MNVLRKILIFTNPLTYLAILLLVIWWVLYNYIFIVVIDLFTSIKKLDDDLLSVIAKMEKARYRTIVHKWVIDHKKRQAEKELEKRKQ
jgi:cytosine/uracil/thiamine/allantoin permease